MVEEETTELRFQFSLSGITARVRRNKKVTVVER